MQTFLLFFDWYFTDLPKKIYQIWANFLWYFKNYFSLSLLLKTFFYPWKMLYLSRGRGFDIEEWFGNLIVNTFSRMIGMVIRFFTIIFGIVVEILTVIAGLIFFIGWLIFPFLLIFCLVKGIQLAI
jgi:hypothetical protein